jgi:hypothetical protein
MSPAFRLRAPMSVEVNRGPTAHAGERDLRRADDADLGRDPRDRVDDVPVPVARPRPIRAVIDDPFPFCFTAIRLPGRFR